MSDNAVYLDYAATTPLDPRVAAVMQSCLAPGGAFANPASVHVAGRRSAALVAQARSQIAGLLHTSPARVIWTSGATESNNLAIRGAAMARAGRGRHLITMPTEHKAVTDPFRALEKDGWEVSWLEPDDDGVLAIEDLAAAIRDDTQLVSIMHVNNETGVMQDLGAIAQLCRQHDLLLHTDAAQSVGRLNLNLTDMPVDLLSLTAHKFYGPQGIGALLIADRPGHGIFPLMYGGSQEQALRPGTLPVHLIAGAGQAAGIAAEEWQNDLRHVRAMRDRLWQGIAGIAGLCRNGADASCYPGILNVSAAGVDGESLMLALEPLCVASGSACNATSGEASHVLRALGRSDAEAQSAVRFSFGRSTTTSDVDFAIRQYTNAVAKLRAMAPLT